MSIGANTFAAQLRHFARSVDIVDDEVFEDVRRLVYKYVKTELGAVYFELMRKESFDGEPGLKMFWSMSTVDKHHTWLFRRAGSDSYSNVVTMAAGTGRPMWVVDSERNPLNRGGRLADDWWGNDDLPPYEPSADQDVRTLVVLPLKRGTKLGVCYFECSSYVGITDVAKIELQMLAEAMSILLELYEAKKTQSLMTSWAIDELQEQLERAKFPRLTKPHFFVAFSSRADEAVRNVISEVLHEFSDRLEFTDWSGMNESGNINAQIAKEITRARFGICYLSEPAKEAAADSDVKYQDNPNVVFEAGMLHGKTVAGDAGDAGEPAGWIPMREASSPPAPFDFAAERTLVIPRFAGGDQLNEAKLRELLTARITRLLGEE
jgi:hypothetical protein